MNHKASEAQMGQGTKHVRSIDQAPVERDVVRMSHRASDVLTVTERVVHVDITVQRTGEYRRDITPVTE